MLFNIVFFIGYFDPYWFKVLYFCSYLIFKYVVYKTSISKIKSGIDLFQ